jgi:hypothetical protein
VNGRLIALSDGNVRFTWKGYRAHGKTKVMTLTADEFIRRLLVHALPDGLASHPPVRLPRKWWTQRSPRARCRQLLDTRVTGAAPEPTGNRAKSALDPSAAVRDAAIDAINLHDSEHCPPPARRLMQLR